MITDRLSSRPTQMMGNLEAKPSTGKVSNLSDKKNDSFMSVLDKSNSKLENKSKVELKSKAEEKESKSFESRPRIEKDLSVKSVPEKETRENEDVVFTESKTQDIESKTEKALSSEGKEELSPKQKAMQKFMDSMESEFGIPPERLVEAMATLSDKDLIKTPNETASQIIGNLDLNEKDSERAMAMYMGMLSQLSQIEKPQANFFSVPVKESHFESFQLKSTPSAIEMSSKERRAILNDSIDKMNQKFFMMKAEQPDVKNIGLTANDSELMPNDQIRDLSMNRELKDQPVYNEMLGHQFVDNSNLYNNIDPEQNSASFDMKDFKTKAGQLKLTEDERDELSQKLATLGLSAAALKEAPNAQNLKMISQEVSKNDADQAMTGLSNQFASYQQLSGDGNQFAQSNSNFNSNSNSKKDELLASSKGHSSTAGSEFFITPTDSKQGQQISNTVAGGSLAQSGNMLANKGDHDQNVQSLMNQVQYVMKKGGGDAVVKLSPEGLGDVHLRVSVQEGKVSVQMAADTKEAKNLIENSLGDLKAGLGAHNLKVDHIKVDVGNQANLQDQNSNSNFHFDQGREQARQFLSNFQEENSANRNGYFEMPGLRAYRGPKQPEPLRASDDTTTASRRNVGQGRGSGLNLVA